MHKNIKIKSCIRFLKKLILKQKTVYDLKSKLLNLVLNTKNNFYGSVYILNALSESQNQNCTTEIDVFFAKPRGTKIIKINSMGRKLFDNNIIIIIHTATVLIAVNSSQSDTINDE